MAPTSRSMDDLYNELLEIKATQNIILDRLNESDNNGPGRASASHVLKIPTQASQNQHHHLEDRVPPLSHNVPLGLSDSRSVFKRQHPDQDDSAPSRDLDSSTALSDQQLGVKHRRLTPAPSTNDHVPPESLAVHPHKYTSFLGIPLEIRLKIYKLLLADCPPLIVNPEDHLESSSIYAAPFPGIHITPLLTVSKQVNAEANPLLWSIPRFHFSKGLFSPGGFDEGAERCKLITDLRVTIGSYENTSSGTPQRRHQLNSQAILFSWNWFGYGAYRRFSGLRHLELDFLPWELEEADEFPRRLVEGFRKQHTRKKLEGVKFLGLGTQPDARKELELAIVGGEYD